MARDRDEEKVRAVRIKSSKLALSDVLKEEPLACILPCQLPRRLEEGVRISVWIYENLEILLHLCVIPREHLGKVVDGREPGICIATAVGNGLYIQTSS